MALLLKKDCTGDCKLLKHQNIPDCSAASEQVDMRGSVCQRAHSKHYEMYNCLLGGFMC